MPIAIITDLFLLEHERTTCNNNFNKYKKDIKQNNNNVDKNTDKNNINENKCCRKCLFFD